MTAPRLHRLIAAGLKGAAIADALSGCDLFAGPNGSGKRTRLIAVQAGLWGCAGTPTDSRRPWLGERPAARVELVFRPGTGRHTDSRSSAGTSRRRPARGRRAWTP